MSDMADREVLEELNIEETLTQPSSKDLVKGIEASKGTGFDLDLVGKLIRILDDCSTQAPELPSSTPFIESAGIDIDAFADDCLGDISAASPVPCETAETTICFETPVPREIRSAEVNCGREKKHKKAKTSQHASTTLLHNLHNKNGRRLKKENLRYQIVRGIKKCARTLANESSREQIPQKGIHQVDKRDAEQVKVWADMKEMAVRHQTSFSSLGSTLNGPKSDARTFRKGEANEKSCNDRYCQLFYSSQLVCEFHYLYIKLVYGTGPVNPADLCKKLSAYCCAGRHTAHCTALWKQIRQYFLFEMIQELDCEPYYPREDISEEYFLQK